MVDADQQAALLKHLLDQQVQHAAASGGGERFRRLGRPRHSIRLPGPRAGRDRQPAAAALWSLRLAGPTGHRIRGQRGPAARLPGDLPPQQARHGVAEHAQRVRAEGLERVHPVRFAQAVFQRLLRGYVLDAIGEQIGPVMNAQRHLALHLRRLVAALREHQHQDRRRTDGLDDLRLPLLPRADVPGGHPAADRTGFQGVPDRLRNPLVAFGVTDEDLVRHDLAPALDILRPTGRRRIHVGRPTAAAVTGSRQPTR